MRFRLRTKIERQVDEVVEAAEREVFRHFVAVDDGCVVYEGSTEAEARRKAFDHPLKLAKRALKRGWTCP